MSWLHLALDILAYWSLASLLFGCLWAIAGWRISRAQERNRTTRNVYFELAPTEWERLN